MIAEVNNTFDERRLYLLRCDHSAPNELYKPQNISSFRHHWPKDFHVSPFNSRKGSYTLKATDVLSALDEPSQAVHVTTTLCSSKNHPKMVACLRSTSPPLDPANMTLISKALFLCSWWSVGLLTFPRIVFEAVKLAHVRGLSIWYRPEIQPATIGRSYTTEEIILERFFRKFLQSKLANSKTTTALRYIAAEQSSKYFCRDVILGIHSASHISTIQNALPEFRVLSPAYYSRFIHYNDSAHAFAQEVQNEAQQNRTATISDEDLKELFSGDMMSESVTWTSNCILVRVLWVLVQRLRLNALPGTYPLPAIPHLRMRGASDAGHHVQEVHLLSALDIFVMTTCPPHEQRTYCCAAILIFSSERFALGSIALLYVYGIALVSLLILLYRSYFKGYLL